MSTQKKTKEAASEEKDKSAARQKQLTKWQLSPFFSKITLHVNGLNSTKRQQAEWIKKQDASISSLQVIPP